MGLIYNTTTYLEEKRLAKKKFYDENGNEVTGVKEKKPFFKKWWFWLIVVVILIAALGGGGKESADTTEASDATSETTTETSSSESTNESSSEEPAETGTLVIGDSFTTDDITVTVTNAYFTDQRNQFDESNPEQVIAIEYILENNSETDYPFGMDFQVYVDGALTDTYANENSMGSVSAGRSVEAIAHYGVNGTTIEAEWEPMMSFSGEKGVWDVTPQ